MLGIHSADEQRFPHPPAATDSGRRPAALSKREPVDRCRCLDETHSRVSGERTLAKRGSHEASLGVVGVAVVRDGGRCVHSTAADRDTGLLSVDDRRSERPGIRRSARQHGELDIARNPPTDRAPNRSRRSRWWPRPTMATPMPSAARWIRRSRRPSSSNGGSWVDRTATSARPSSSWVSAPTSTTWATWLFVDDLLDTPNNGTLHTGGGFCTAPGRFGNHRACTGEARGRGQVHGARNSRNRLPRLVQPHRLGVGLHLSQTQLSVPR